MVAPHVRAGKLRYVLEDFEVEPLPVSFVYPAIADAFADGARVCEPLHRTLATRAIRLTRPSIPRGRLFAPYGVTADGGEG